MFYKVRKPIKDIDYSKFKVTTFKGVRFAPTYCQLCKKELVKGDKYYSKAGKDVHVSCLAELRDVA